LNLTVLVFDEPFPEYTSPYTNGPKSRDFPSPGHLAHAMRIPVAQLPYKPRDSIEASNYATVATILHDVIKSQSSAHQGGQA